MGAALSGKVRIQGVGVALRGGVGIVGWGQDQGVGLGL